jgi:hypothetical protein
MNWLLQIIFSWVETASKLTGDIAWEIATSPPVLITLGAVAIAGWMVSHLPMVERWCPAVIPYTRAAWLANIVASAALVFLLGFSFAHDRAEVEKVKNDLAWAQYELEMKAAAEQTAFEQLSEAKAKAAEAEGKLSEYESKFGKNPSDPPPGALEWMRSLQQHPQRRAGAGSDQPQRGRLARVRAIGSQRQ